MKEGFDLKEYSSRTLLIIVLILFGFIASKALVSIGTGALLLNLILSFREHNFKFVKKSNFIILSPILFFLGGLLLFLFSPDYAIALENTWIKLPWLISPLSVAAIPKITKTQIDLILSFLVFLFIVSGAVVLGNYLSNYSFYTEQIAVGKHIPTPLNHIRYSLMLAFAGIISLFYFIKNHSKLTKYDRVYFGFASIFLFLLLHILSVRSGLVCYYIALIYLMLYFTYSYKKWWLLPLVALFLVGMPYLAYHNIRSFKNKVDYMTYDLEQLNKENIGHNSDSRRWRSLEIGWQLVKEKPLFGHGIGQAETVTSTYYMAHFPEVEDFNRKIPHNQFLFTSLETGFLGLTFLLLALGISLVSTLVFKRPLYVSLSLIFLASCLVENTFESQVGMTFFLIVGSLLLKAPSND